MERGLLKRIEEKVVIFDGAMGTMLMSAGLGPGEIPEIWNMEKPQRIREVHESYFRAGADVVETNTFGGNPIKLADRGLAERMEAVNLAAVELAREICPEGRFVAGSIGPTGKMIEPLGKLTPLEAEEAFYQQASVLIRGGADLICIETMFSLEEALAALRGTRRAGDVPVCATMTFTRTKKGFFTMMGEGVKRCVTALEAAGADIIGANCTLGSRDMIGLTGEIRAATGRPVLIQPNAGRPITRNGVTHYDQTPEDFARDGAAIKEEGANLIGGCCGTDATFIRALVTTLS